MSTIRTYICNLCRESICSVTDGIGIHFGCIDEEGRHQPTIRFRKTQLIESENHLCLKCLDGIALLIDRTQVLNCPSDNTKASTIGS